MLSEKTLSERGYSATGRLLGRVLSVLVGLYPIKNRFVNSDEWDSPGKHHMKPSDVVLNESEFEKDHNLYWGKAYKAEDVKIDWHGAFLRISK